MLLLCSEIVCWSKGIGNPKLESPDCKSGLTKSHIDDFMAGRVNKMYELKEIADIMCLHPVHLSKVIKLETGHHACYFYEQRILLEAKKLLTDTALPFYGYEGTSAETTHTFTLIKLRD